MPTASHRRPDSRDIPEARFGKVSYMSVSTPAVGTSFREPRRHRYDAA
ncbi:hypothetical protein KEM60_02938 [Austwickia sp. TVS 96-490-7B]|nr:hypothetical protein [Austwickia sp. TVS 96-490-7B]